MIFLGLEKINNEKARVSLIHNFPDMLPSEELNKGVLVEVVPESEEIDEKRPVLYYNYTNNSVYYEYEAKILTETELLKQKVAEQELAIIELASLVGGNV